MQQFRTVIESNSLLPVIEIPDNIKNKKVELILKTISEDKELQKRDLLKTNIKLNGYKFNRDEANER